MRRKFGIPVLFALLFLMGCAASIPSTYPVSPYGVPEQAVKACHEKKGVVLQAWARANRSTKKGLWDAEDVVARFGQNMTAIAEWETNKGIYWFWVCATERTP